MSGLIFGISEAHIRDLGLAYGVGGLMLLMVFIVGHLAWESKAGKFGTFALFLGLTFGMVGYIAKYVIKIKLGIL